MRLLVVEDEESMADSLKRGLEAEGFAVDVAVTGTDGLHLARQVDYDAIVLDLMLPGLNGYQVCQSLRDDENWTPILMLTAKQGDLDEAEGLETGADDYLTKPFSFVVLVARLRAMLRRAESSRPVAYQAGDLSVDANTRSVTRAGKDVSLTAREFAVLEQLVRSAGEVVSKQQIVEHVWDLHFDGDLNIVECTSARFARSSTSRSVASPSRPFEGPATCCGPTADEVAHRPQHLVGPVPGHGLGRRRPGRAAGGKRRGHRLAGSPPDPSGGRRRSHGTGHRPSSTVVGRGRPGIVGDGGG
jgi:DNA-binding response OmpR family regulator